VALDDPVAKYLPADVKMPNAAGGADYARGSFTHTSGLPRLPSNLKPADSSNPYADYTVKQLYEFLSGYTLTRDIGAQFEYSNFGGGYARPRIGAARRRECSRSWSDRIAQPLGMKSTGIDLVGCDERAVAW